MSGSKKLNFSQYTKVWARPFFVTAMLIMLFMIQTSCQPETKKSVLILAFDQLDNERLNCLEEENNEHSGIAIICKEFMRFTHAYTTSLQPAAAIGSLLTGQYPASHNVHRSFDIVNSQLTTIQEAAHAKNYRTGFFAGNPHVLKKTGLSKYFETFDDSAAAQYSNHIVKDFRITSESFLEWQKEETSAPFFAVITNSEIDALNEKDTTTTSIEKLDEKLFAFITKLKESGVWDQTYVFIVGLKGSNNYNRLNETSYLNLHSENTMISLMIKPPRMQGDEGISWKNDIPITIADIGYTLKNFFGVDEQSRLPAYQLLDLSQFYMLAPEKKSNPRNLLIEAANPWTRSLQLNFAIINSTVLMLNRSEEPEIYNLVNDRFEVVDLYNKKATYEAPTIRRAFPHAIILNDDELTYVTTAKDYLKNSILSKVPETHPLFMYWLKTQNKVDVNRLDREFASCLKYINKPPTSISQLKSCNNSLFVDYLKFKYADIFGLNIEKAKLTYDLNRKKYLEEIKIAIWNLALENIWGLHKPGKTWYNPLVFIDAGFVQ